jgi:glutamine amidotransferase-like uncharacterized protein
MMAARKFFGARVRFDLVFRGFLSTIPLIFIFSAIHSHAKAEPITNRPVAVAYNGKGACPEKCASSIAAIARQVGLQVKYVNHKTLSPAVLQGASLYIQPGGNALEVLDALHPEQLQAIRDYVFSGGRYLGICAGAFLADTYVDEKNTRLGLGILPGETIDYHPVEPMPPEMILKTTWSAGLLPKIAGLRHMYFSDGVGFRLTHPEAKVEVLSVYDADQIVSTVRFAHGAGKVILTGVHPEAPKKWWHPDEKRDLPLEDPDGVDHDIARALIQSLVQD